MASVIDGTTYKGYWKLIPDSNSSGAFFLCPKSSVFFQSTDDTNGVFKDMSGNVSVSTDNTTIDESGNALDTSAKISEYISKTR